MQAVVGGQQNCLMRHRVHVHASEAGGSQGSKKRRNAMEDVTNTSDAQVLLLLIVYCTYRSDDACLNGTFSRPMFARRATIGCHKCPVFANGTGTALQWHECFGSS
jgi:hypothetical protein